MATVRFKYQNDGRAVTIDFPMCASMLSGTPEQVVHFTPSLNDGMPSRALWCLLTSNWKWKPLLNEEPEGSIDDDFKELAPYILNMHELIFRFPVILYIESAFLGISCLEKPKK